MQHNYLQALQDPQYCANHAVDNQPCSKLSMAELQKAINKKTYHCRCCCVCCSLIAFTLQAWCHVCKCFCNCPVTWLLAPGPWPWPQEGAQGWNGPGSIHLGPLA